MLGPDYLFSPVTAYNATIWNVYLPSFEIVGNATGGSWVHHYTNRTYGGGQVVAVDVSDLDTFPLFKRHPSVYATV